MTDIQVDAFVQKLGAFRATLSAGEQQALDAMLLATAHGEASDVEGYAFRGASVKHLALAAVMTLGIVGGTLGPALGGSAAAAPLDQPSLNGNMGGGSSSSSGSSTQTPRQQPPTTQQTGTTARTGNTHTPASNPTGTNQPGTLRDPLQEALRGIQPLGAPQAPRQPTLEQQLQQAQDDILRDAIRRQREAEIARQMQEAENEILRQAERLQQSRELAESMRRAEEQDRLRQARELAESTRRAEQQDRLRGQIAALATHINHPTPTTVAQADADLAATRAARDSIQDLMGQTDNPDTHAELRTRFDQLTAEMNRLTAAKQTLLEQTWQAADQARARAEAEEAARRAEAHRNSEAGIVEGAQAANDAAAGLSQPGEGNIMNRVQQNIRENQGGGAGSTPTTTGPTRVQPGVDWTQE
jgi:hypothetical protein